MKVYLVYEGSYEERTVFAAYASLEAAQTMYDHGHEPKWVAYDEGRWTCDWSEVRHRARVAINAAFEIVKVPVVAGVATLPDGRTVESTADVVSVPVLPPGALDGPIIDSVDRCDVDIEEHEVLS